MGSEPTITADASAQVLNQNYMPTEDLLLKVFFKSLQYACPDGIVLTDMNENTYTADPQSQGQCRQCLWRLRAANFNIF